MKVEKIEFQILFDEEKMPGYKGGEKALFNAEESSSILYKDLRASFGGPEHFYIWKLSRIQVNEHAWAVYVGIDAMYMQQLVYKDSLSDCLKHIKEICEVDLVTLYGKDLTPVSFRPSKMGVLEMLLRFVAKGVEF